MADGQVIVILGSPSDASWGEQIVQALRRWGLAAEVRVASAHKTPEHLLRMLSQYEADGRPRVYITVAGRSNALSGLVDAQVVAPVIACPPYGDRYAGMDLLSSLRMPAGVAPAVVLEPENAALLAAKMLAMADPALQEAIRQGREEGRRRLLEADAKMQEVG